MLENVQAFGVSRHQAILDTVVNHLDEVAGSGRATVKIPFLGGATNFVASRRAIDVATARRERFENRIEALHDLRLATDHLAIAALEAPYASACADVAIVDSLFREFFRAANVIDIVGISSIDHGIKIGRAS